MKGKITFHFDGPIVADHKITLRVLGGTLSHLQSAIDRAYLDIKYGSVWKHAHLKDEDYSPTDFIIGTPQEGGYILDLVRSGGGQIVRRISQAVRGVIDAPFREGAGEMEHLAAQVAARKSALASGVYKGRTHEKYIAAPEREAIRRYGDRSIAKEIDQILVAIRRNHETDRDQQNILELEFRAGTEAPAKFSFNRNKAIQFHSTIARRDLGEPLIYTGVLRSIDRGRNSIAPKAKLTLANNKRDITLHIGSSESYQQLAPFMQGNKRVKIFACPVLEFNSFDPNSGDAYFVSIVD